MHYLIKKAYKELYNEEPDFEATLKYSKAFKGYNANARYTATSRLFKLSYVWKEVSDEIKIGLIQSLFNKINKTNINTINIDMYEIFLKKLPKLTPITESNPMLEDSFDRMNNMYFNGLLMKPNLKFGGKNFHTLGTYDYGTDTIMIASTLKKDMHLLDYVMYHEMLHKKLQYKKTGKRTLHHSTEFRRLEKQFHDPNIEEKLKKFLRKEKIKSVFW